MKIITIIAVLILIIICQQATKKNDSSVDVNKRAPIKLSTEKEEIAIFTPDIESDKKTEIVIDNINVQVIESENDEQVVTEDDISISKTELK